MSCQTKNSARFDAEIQAEIGKLEEDVTKLESSLKGEAQRQSSWESKGTPEN